MSEESKANTNSGSGRQINTGGGAYNEGTINNSGGVSISGGTNSGAITYNDNRVSASDSAKIEELFKTLHQQIESAPAATPQDKADAQEAAQGLKQEVEQIKKDPNHQPNKFQMQGFIAAFKKLGAPVFNAAMTVIGLPVLGQAVNQFAQALPDGSDNQ